MQIGELLPVVAALRRPGPVVLLGPLKILLSLTGFLLSIKECMSETLSVRSRCPVTQAAWDRGLPPPPKMRYMPSDDTWGGGGGAASPCSPVSGFDDAELSLLAFQAAFCPTCRVMVFLHWSRRLSWGRG